MNPSPLDGNAGSADVPDGTDVTAVTQLSAKPLPHVDSASLSHRGSRDTATLVVATGPSADAHSLSALARRHVVTS